MLLLLVQPLCLLPLLFLLSKLEEKKAEVCVSIASLKLVKRPVNLFYMKEKKSPDDAPQRYPQKQRPLSSCRGLEIWEWSLLSNFPPSEK